MDLFKKTTLDASVLSEIKKLHFQTSRLADQTIAGSYRSAYRGTGIEFEEVREYVPGDDVRRIDWKVTAKRRKAFVKSYREERELTVIIAVDVSASTQTGTRSQTREALMAKVGAVLSLIALRNNDKVGLVTYSDRLETFHPPRKARSSVWRVLHEVLSPGVYQPGTDLPGLLSFLYRVLKRKAIIFVLSDFQQNGLESDLQLLAKKHDVTLIRVLDPADTVLPNIGLAEVTDPETQTTSLIDTSSELVRAWYKATSEKKQAELSALCLKQGVDLLELKTNQAFVPELRGLFQKKSHLSRSRARR